MQAFSLRTLAVHREQERLRRNLGKYNNFVREKHLKVSDGDRIFQEEKAFQESIAERIRDRRDQLECLERAKVEEVTNHFLHSTSTISHGS